MTLAPISPLGHHLVCGHRPAGPHSPACFPGRALLPTSQHPGTVAPPAATWLRDSASCLCPLPLGTELCRRRRTQFNQVVISITWGQVPRDGACHWKGPSVLVLVPPPRASLPLPQRLRRGLAPGGGT